MHNKKIICIVGPTACHKTETSIELAKRTNGEIVSADSVQVYIGMDIGSAKPTIEEQQGIKHHMIDCVSINTPEFSVSQFRILALQAIDDILTRGKTPIVVGGSGLYVNALTFPLGFAIPRDDKIRKEMESLYENNPHDAFDRLIIVDPITAERLHVNDKKRVIRALEVYACSGKPLSSYGNDFTNESGNTAPCEPLMIGLDMDRKLLYERINLRVDLMMKNGLLDEAKRIYDVGYDAKLPAMQSIGYRQLFSYFSGVCTLNEAIEKIKLDTRHFAKRQLTWFRRDKRIVWHDVTDYNAVKNGMLTELSTVASDWMKG